MSNTFKVGDRVVFVAEPDAADWLVGATATIVAGDGGGSWWWMPDNPSLRRKAGNGRWRSHARYLQPLSSDDRFDEWCEAVDEILRVQYGIGIDDVGEAVLRDEWAGGGSPSEFVVMYARLYGLTPIHLRSFPF